MSVDAYKNFSYSTVLTAPSPASSGTSLVVQSGDGTKFPSVPFNVVIWPTASQPTTANAEIVRVTSVSTDTFTITRQQEGTSARTVVVGDQIMCGITALVLDNLRKDVFSNIARNCIINGGFDIWQRNTTFTTPNDDTYTADRWNCLQEANGAWTFSRSTDVPSTLFNYSIKAVNVTANNQCGIVTLIENLNAKKIAGQTVSLSFYAKTTTSKVISNLRATILAWTGSADAMTSDVVGTWAQDGTDPTWATSYTSEVAGANKALTTSWQQFTIENVALDTSSTNNYAVVIWVDDGTITATDEFYVTGVQLHVGNINLNYNPLSIDDEFRRCQRYYQKSYEEGTFPAAATTTGIIEFDWANAASVPSTIGAGSMLLPVQMRAAPTFTPYDAAGNSGKCTIYDSGAAGTDNTSINSYRASSKGLTLRVYNVAAHGVTFHYTLEAEL